MDSISSDMDFEPGPRSVSRHIDGKVALPHLTRSTGGKRAISIATGTGEVRLEERETLLNPYELDHVHSGTNISSPGALNFV